MNKQGLEEVLLKIGFFVFIIYIMTKILIPIINPIKAAADINYSQDNFFKQVVNKACPSIEVVYDSYEDEEKKELFPLLFKYLTNIDLSNPKTYIASQIPILQFIDLTTLMADESGPVVVVPNENINDGKSSTSISPTPSNSTSPTTDNTTGKTVNPNDSQKVTKKALNPKKPVVLIFHTHTTECYNPQGIKGAYFSDDLTKGVCSVGEELKKELENTYGIAVIHDMTVHDLPRDGGYKKARPTISSYLKKYPSIKVVIDLHRDGGLKRSSSTAVINNVNYARTMFVIGTKNKYVSKNKAFAEKLHSTLESLYPGFSKGLYYEKAVYNEDLFSNLALVEVGSDINSLDEALRTAKLFAKILAINLK